MRLCFMDLPASRAVELSLRSTALSVNQHSPIDDLFSQSTPVSLGSWHRRSIGWGPNLDSHSLFARVSEAFKFEASAARALWRLAAHGVLMLWRWLLSS